MQKLTVSDYIEIGTTGYRIGVDSANNAIKVYKEDGSAVNFYASGAVSAKVSVPVVAVEAAVLLTSFMDIQV